MPRNPENRKVEKESPRLEDDPRYKEILERRALEYLKTKDTKWFLREYSGEVALSGYLMNKEGKETNFLPSQCIGREYDKIKAETLQEYEQGGKEKVESKGFRCPNCGNVIPRDVNFCAYCGERIKKEEPETKDELNKARQEAEEAFEEGGEKE